MRNPEVFVAYAPRGAGLRCAIAYLEGGPDIYGWFSGPRHDLSIAGCYFLLGDFHASAPLRYEVVDQTGLHSAWSLDEPRRHELARLQDAFAREWLLHPDAPDAATELAAYREAELAIGAIGLRYARLAKLSKLQPNWTYYTPRFERSVLRHLAGRWSLEYRPDVGAEPKRRAAGPRV